MPEQQQAHSSTKKPPTASRPPLPHAPSSPKCTNQSERWSRLEVSHANLGVVSIVGLGGLGKTTLAGQVFCSIQHNFSATTSVSVSWKPNMKGIIADIVIMVGISEITPNDDEHRLITRLGEHLKDKRYFIIIDDLWELESWDQIKLALVDNNLGSRIIITTCNMAAASCCSDNVYQMEVLSIADSRRLCFKRAFYYEELDSSYSHLEKVSIEILAKCGGLPFIFSIGAEDVEILGSIPALLSVKLRTMVGTNGRIFIRGFTCLKHFPTVLLSQCNEEMNHVNLLENITIKSMEHRLAGSKVIKLKSMKSK